MKKAEGEKKEPQMVVRLSHKEKKKVAVLPSPPKKEKIRAHDYDKWDKFNVEEECKKVDKGIPSYSIGHNNTLNTNVIQLTSNNILIIFQGNPVNKNLR